MSRWLAGTSVMSWPSTTIRPESGSSSPASARSAVVLPQPDGPEQRDQLARGQLQCQAVQGVDRPVVALHVEQLHGDPASRPVASCAGAAEIVMCDPFSLRFLDLRRSAAGHDGDAEDEHEREQQRGQRDRDRDERIALAEQVDDHLQRVVVEQRRDGELAEHQRDRDHRGRQDRAADVGHDDLEHHARPSGARGCGPPRPASPTSIDRRPGVDGPVGDTAGPG